MVYECDNCEAALGPGLTVCPRCGQVFDEPVPADALWDDLVPIEVVERAAEPSVIVEAAPLEAAPLEAAPLEAAPLEAAPLEVVTRPRLRVSRHRWLRTIAAGILILELGWLGYYQWGRPIPPEPVFLSAPRLADLAAHPQYAAHMTALVQQLRGTGVGAEWPAFGSDDMLLITPQARAAEPPVAWDADMDRRLAQGIYGDFVLTRHESGFPDTDSMACFVLVTSPSGQVVAVDFMGELK